MLIKRSVPTQSPAQIVYFKALTHLPYSILILNRTSYVNKYRKALRYEMRSAYAL